jgi:hypothetical protein
MTDQIVISLSSKIAKAALDVGGKLSADKTNIEQHYSYISADKTLSICGQALFNQGVIVMPEIASQEIKLLEYTDAYGKPKKRYDSLVEFSMIISDGVNTQILKWFGMGSDYTVPDKAHYKAVTSGHKYFMLKLLCVGADNEDSEHDDEEQKNGNGKIQVKVTPVGPAANQARAAEIVNEISGPVVPSAKMDLATAATAKNKDGVLYTTLPDETLRHMRSQINKEFNKPHTPEEMETYHFKSDAITVILNSRPIDQPEAV